MIDSVRVRLTLWHVAAVAFLLFIFSGAVYSLQSNVLYEQVDAVIASVVEGTVSMLAKESSETKVALLAPQHALRALFFPDTSLAIFGPDGKLIAEKTARGHRIEPSPAMTAPIGELRKYTARGGPDGGGGIYRGAALRVSFPPVNITYTIVANQSLEPIRQQLAALRGIFFVAIPTVLVLAGFGGWFLARKSLAPVVAMAEQARRISAENLDERLFIANDHDELGHLASAFNELLARVANTFSRQRQFMADASHELRTPVSVIATATSVALDRLHRGEDEYRSTLAIIEGQVLRLSRIVEDSFRLALADSGCYVLRPQGFYLDELLAATARVATVLATSKEISIEVPHLPELPYWGDEDLLRQMILNLLDNAIKYTPRGGNIRLGLDVLGSDYAITVSDSGSGIPATAQPHIFERFFRVERSRSRAEGEHVSGAGLGLSISRWIAEAHRGHLELSKSDEQGSTFVALLPCAPQKFRPAARRESRSVA